MTRSRCLALLLAALIGAACSGTPPGGAHADAKGQDGAVTTPPSKDPKANTPSKAEPPSSSAEPTAIKPLAIVYRGPATCDGDGGECAPAWADMFKSCQPGFDVMFVGPGESSDVTPEVLAKAGVFIYPGGNDSIAKDWKHVAGYRDAIRDFVQRGGRYLGSCTGGYLAATNPWAGTDIGFGLLPGNAGEYVGSPGADITTTGDTLVDVVWKDVWGNSKHPIYLQDGAFFEAANASSPGVLVLATYAANGAIAALVAPFGKGKVGVEGPHAEAPLSWYEANGVGGNPDFAPGCDLIAKTLAP